MKTFLPTAALLFLSVTGASAGGDAPPAAAGDRHGGASGRLRIVMQSINATTHDTGNVDSMSDRIGSRDMEQMTGAIEELLYYAELLSTVPPG